MNRDRYIVILKYDKLRYKAGDMFEIYDPNQFRVHIYKIEERFRLNCSYDWYRPEIKGHTMQNKLCKHNFITPYNNKLLKLINA